MQSLLSKAAIIPSHMSQSGTLLAQVHQVSFGTEAKDLFHRFVDA